jgi:hypothetical protein
MSSRFDFDCFDFVWEGASPPSDILSFIECDESFALNDSHLQSVFANSHRGVERCVWSVWRILAATVLLRLRRFGFSNVRARIDARLALLEFASEQFVQPRSVELWDPLSGFFQCANNRFVRLHCNFPHHRRAALALLSLPIDATRDLAIERIRSLDAFELERRAIEFNAIVAAARTPDEWQQSTLFNQVESNLFEIKTETETKTKTNDETTTTSTSISVSVEKPLNEIVVVDLTRVLAGPICCRTLAQLWCRCCSYLAFECARHRVGAA